ncbi:MFS transporter [Reyranella sp.]|uniref:MFS transporter n=1 Tax=Reyranella sp. TaxID=1929291 RepID=UPI003D11F1D4
MTTAVGWRPLLPIYLTCLGYGVLAGTGMPLIPLALEHRGVDTITIGLIEAVWGIGMIATAHRIPAIAARLGAVRLVLVALLCGATLDVTFAFTENLALWFVLSFLSGMVSGVPWVVSEIWINIVVDERQRGRATALYSAIMAIGLAMGPLALQVVGVYGPQPFLTCAAFALLVALPLLLVHEAPAIAPDSEGGFSKIVLMVPALLICALACGLGEQAAFSFLPIYGLKAGVPAETAVLWLSAFVIGNIALQWPIGWVADHVDRRVVLATCALASAGLTAALPAIDPHSQAILVVLVLWGGISFAIYAVGLALLGQRFKGGDIARANAALTSIYTFGGMVGPPIAGSALELLGRPGFGLSLAVVYGFAGIGALLALRRPG